MKYLFGAASLAALLGNATLATAETTEPEQILVSASRLPESALNLPLAWSSVDTSALELTNPVHSSEIMQRVPGAWLSRGNGQESLPALRSPVLTGAGGCGAFLMASDGISLRAPGFCNVNQMFDANIEQAGRIEVLRGPATAVYGSNAMHGVINVISEAPSAEPRQRISMEAGPYDYYRGKYHYGNTFGRNGISFSINGTTDGGYQDDSGYDQQKFTLRHDYAGDVWNFSSALDYSNLNQETAGYIQGDEAYKDEDLRETNPNPEAYRDAWSVLAYSRASRDIGDNHQLVLTPYLRDNGMEFRMHFVPWQPTEENGHRSLGMQAALHSDLGDTQWVNGIDFDYTDGWLKETQADDFSPNQPAGTHYDYDVLASTAAAFSQLRWQRDALELSGGLRLEYTRYDYDNRTGDGPACAPEATACRFYRPADREDDFSNLSANLGASYAFAERQIVYLRAARGFRAPQAAELYRLQSGQAVADLDSEELDNLEFGLRGDLGDLSYDVALYFMDKDDVIFQDANRFNVSGASTEHRGLEISLDYVRGDWYMDAKANFARHRYSSRTELLGSSGDIKGNDVDTAPRSFGSARLGHNFARGITGELEWVYMDDYYLDPDNSAEYEGHSLFNLHVLAPFAERWQLGLRVTNLLDEDYAERADFGFGNYRYFVGRPRGAFFELSYRN